MKLIECEKTTAKHEKRTVPAIKGTWQEGPEKVSEVWHSVRAGVAFPVGKEPGFLILGGQTFEKTIRVLAEVNFPVLAYLVEALPELIDTLFLSVVYHEGTEETLGFCNRVKAELRDREQEKAKLRDREQEKAKDLSFRPAYRAEFPGFGNDLVREYLLEGRLLIPGDGELALQMQGSWQEEEEALYTIKALRFLVSGFHFEPFRPPAPMREGPPLPRGGTSWMGM